MELGAKSVKRVFKERPYQDWKGQEADGWMLLLGIIDFGRREGGGVVPCSPCPALPCLPCLLHCPCLHYLTPLSHVQDSAAQHCTAHHGSPAQRG